MTKEEKDMVRVLHDCYKNGPKNGNLIHLLKRMVHFGIYAGHGKQYGPVTLARTIIAESSKTQLSRFNPNLI